MPATKISALAAGGASQATDEYVVARAGDNRKITGANIAAAATAVGTLTSGAIGAGFTPIPNTALANSSITINGTPVSLGGTATISASAAGSNTQVQFNSSGSLAGDSGFTFSSTNKAMTLGGATITANAPVLDLTQTWNNAAVVFTGIKFNATNTASNATSNLIDLQVGGSSRFRVDVGGSVVTEATYFVLKNAGLWMETGGSQTFFRFGSPSATVIFGIATSSFQLGVATEFGWNAGTPFQSTFDLRLVRDAADTLAQRRTTTAQTFRLYRTFTDASNYERLSFGWSSSTAIVATEGAGTGTRGNLAFGTAALATSATRGHLMIPSCAGVATGVPADIPTGQVALIFDSTNNKLGVYDGGWIWTAALT